VLSNTHLQNVMNFPVEDANAADLGVVGDAHGAEGVVGGSGHGAGAARSMLVRVKEVIPWRESEQLSMIITVIIIIIS